MDSKKKKKGMLLFSISAVNESVTEIGLLSNPTLSFSLCILSVRGIPLLQFRDCFLLSPSYGSGYLLLVRFDDLSLGVVKRVNGYDCID